jgi:hypothetical protein
MPPLRHPPEHILQVEQGVSRSWETTPGGKYTARSRQPGSGRDAQRDRAAQATGGRVVTGKPYAQKKLAGQGNAVGRMIRRDQAEKQEIIHLVEHSQLSLRHRLDELNVPPGTFYHILKGFDLVESPAFRVLRPRISSNTPPNGSTNCGRRISPASRSWGGQATNFPGKAATAQAAAACRSIIISSRESAS